MLLRPFATTLLALATFAIAACDDGGSAQPKCAPEGGCAAGMDAATGLDGALPSGSRILRGRVFDAVSARALPKATLAATEAKLSATSDATGRYELASDAALGRLEITRKDYAPTRKAAPATRGYLEVFLKAVDKRVQFRGDEGGSFQLDTGERLEIPADAVLDSEGKPVAGLITLEIAAVDGQKRSQAAALPGDAVARRKDKREGRLGIETALEIRMLDAKGTQLDVDPAKDVIADVPARGRDADKQLGVYSYDDASQRWKEEGVAPVSDTDGKRRYRADIDHLSWWSYAKFYGDVGCVSACVEDGKGQPVVGAQVWIVGASVAGVSTFFTGDDGCGKGDVVADAKVVLVAQAEGQVSQTKSLTAGKAGAQCTDAGVLVLGPPSSEDCASGFASCGDNCVDATTNPGGDVCTLVDGGATGTLDAAGGAEVQGLVVDNYLVPVGGLELVVDGQSVTSATDGTFTVSGVRIPYAILVTEQVSRDDGQTAYAGITRTNPRLIYNGSPNMSGARLTGNLTGGAGFPLPPNHRTDIRCIGGPSNITFGGIQNPPSNAGWGPYTQQWRTGNTFSCTLFAMQYLFSPFTYTGMGSKAVTLQNGVDLGPPDTNIALSAVTTHTLSGTITAPVGTTFSYVSLNVGGSTQTAVPTGSTYVLNAPDNVPAGIPMSVTVSGSLNGASVNKTAVVTSTTTQQDLAIDVPITLVSPADDAGNVGATQAFSVMRPSGSLAEISFSWETGDPDVDGVTYHSRSVLFDGDSITLGEMRAAGLDLPAGGSLSWLALSRAPVASVDEYLSPDRDPLERLSTTYTVQRAVNLAR